MFNPFKQNKKEPKSLKEVLNKFQGLEKSFESLTQELDLLKKEGRFSIQKIGIVRFNPFSDVGGDQSFSLALLDGNNSGFVLTSLYTRQENRVYGKPIIKGQSKYSLSKEEEDAIKQAAKLNTATAGSGDVGSR